MNKLPVSPKLSLGLLLGLLSSSILANLATVSPAMLHLGPWSPFVYGTAAALVFFVSGYFKTDTLMTAGAAAQAANQAAATADTADPAPAPAQDLPVLPATAALPAVPAPLSAQTLTAPAPVVTVP